MPQLCPPKRHFAHAWPSKSALNTHYNQAMNFALPHSISSNALSLL
jgi:hypothetical protein